MTTDVFEAAKLDQNRESVRAVRHREEQAKWLHEQMEHVDIAGSPYSSMSDGLVLECCAREGLIDCASWPPEKRIAALEVLRLARQAEAEAAAGGPVPVAVDRLERAVQPPPPKVPKPRAPPKLKVDQLPLSANGVYRVAKDGRAYIKGSPVDFRAGKRIDASYAPNMQAMLDCGIVLEPEVPVGGELDAAAEVIAAVTAERDAATAKVAELEAAMVAMTLDRDIAATERDLAHGQLAEANARIVELSMGTGKSPEAVADETEDDGGDEPTASEEADTVPPPNRPRRRKPQGG